MSSDSVLSITLDLAVSLSLLELIIICTYVYNPLFLECNLDA
jgi:hypothetical protein